MTIRRAERSCDAAAVEDDISAVSDEDASYDNFLASAWETKVPPLDSTDTPVHPATTDFGPESLANFIRAEIEKTKSEGGNSVVDGNGKGNGKGKGRETEILHPSLPYPTPRPPNPADAFISSDGADDNPVQPSTLKYAENALRHLRGLRDPPCKPFVISFSQFRPPSRSRPGRRLSSPPAKRSVTSLDRVVSAGSEDASADPDRRSIDFEDHAESVRNRNRSEHRRHVHRDPGGHCHSNESEESPPRPRKTVESLSHLVQARPATPDSDVSTASPRRAGRTPSETPAIFTASSRLHISDVEEDPRPDLAPSQSEEVADPCRPPVFPSESSDDSLNDSDGGPAPDPQHRVYEQAVRAEMNIVRRELARNSLSGRRPSRTTTGPSQFDYAVYVPSPKPRFVPSKGQPASQPVPKTAPSTPERSLSLGTSRRHRAASAANQDTDVEDAIIATKRPAKSSKSSKASSTKTLTMVADYSKPSWVAKSPLPDIAKYRNDPLDPALGGWTTLPGFNYDIWVNVADHLSSEDLKRLRLVNHAFAEELAPIMLRSVVTNFGRSMFQLGDWTARDVVPASTSMLAKHGKDIHKFGISFDYDAMGLAYAQPKIFTRQETAWYGSYRWPLENYPRFSRLQELEDLVDDNRPLLKNAFADLTSVSELALSLDSGHGWLEGPDISDMALFEARRKKGTKVFGQSFVEDVWHTYGRNEYFKWAQQNSINASLKMMASKTQSSRIRQNIRSFGRMMVREYASFCDVASQPDFDPYCHTGGQVVQGVQAAQQPQQNAVLMAGLPVPPLPPAPQHPAPGPTAGQPAALQQAGAARPRIRGPRHGRQTPSSSARDRHRRQNSPIPLQYPLIFNCYNLAADVGSKQLVSRTADPSNFPLIPGHLTEAQVQWLMETLWAQRAFLSAYTTAVITQKLTLKKVHTLTLAKISSGLLPSLAQREFWTSLAGLKRLKILVKPDWREEHIPGDKFFAGNMPTNPCFAAGKFADFLEQYIARIENLSHLSIGYFGGGEHATGMFARNTHVLPAPITNSPRQWVTDHEKKPDSLTMFAFPHIRDLTFENCWFSPCMLEAFMEKSRDTSLHTLILDSVSMLSRHSTSIDGPLSTVRNGLRCTYDPENWLAETLPASAVWTEVLDKITPGATLEEMKHKAGMIDNDLSPFPAREFRGNITKIVLKSCGYAKVSGFKGDQFNQNALVVQVTGAQVPAAAHQRQNIGWNGGQGSTCDAGLLVRSSRFDKVNLRFLDYSDINPANDNQGGPPAVGLPGAVHGHVRRRSRPSFRRGSSGPGTAGGSTREGAVMMPTTASDGNEYFGLGTLTQCIHPIEKRVLESAWGMMFGWGNTMTRWDAVEDGWLEGGTGRFSGVIGVADYLGAEDSALADDDD